MPVLSNLIHELSAIPTTTTTTNTASCVVDLTDIEA